MGAKIEFPTRTKRLPSGRVPLAAIRRYVDRVVAEFHPQRVILFGSHAYGKPHADSDVDLLVVMNAPNELTKSVRIYRKLPPPFSMDLIVRTPGNLARRLGWNDWFLREIVDKGIVLYDAADSDVGAKSGRGLAARQEAEKRKAAVP